jgi:hypothetical protein
MRRCYSSEALMRWQMLSSVRAARSGTKGAHPSASAPGLGSLLPHLHQDSARPRHICGWTGLAPATPASGPGSPRTTSAPGLHAIADVVRCLSAL